MKSVLCHWNWSGRFIRVFILFNNRPPGNHNFLLFGTSSCHTSFQIVAKESGAELFGHLKRGTVNDEIAGFAWFSGITTVCVTRSTRSSQSSFRKSLPARSARPVGQGRSSSARPRVRRPIGEAGCRRRRRSLRTDWSASATLRRAWKRK